MTKQKPIGVTMDCVGNPTLLFSDGCTYPKNVEQILYKEYYPKGEHWPIDPETGEKLPVALRPDKDEEPLLCTKTVRWAYTGLMTFMLILFYFYS